VKEFTSSVQARTNGQPQLQNLPFTLDGVTYELRAPKQAQLAFLFASASLHRSSSDRVAAMLDFLEAALTPPGDEAIRLRLLDPEDALDLDAVMDIMNWAMEEWTGRPPTSANGSSRRPSVVGRRTKAISSGKASTR
jgi:hypothetical protein